MPEKIVTIFGTSRTNPGESIYTLAYEIGQQLAWAGFTIANGGYEGTMLACAEGACSAGGEVIGVTCLAFGKGKANKYISREIVTKTLDERLDSLIKLGQGYVVLPGGTGTLLELAKVWELKNKGFPNSSKPIILLGDFWKPLAELVATDDPRSSSYIHFVKDAKEAKNFLAENI